MGPKFPLGWQIVILTVFVIFSCTEDLSESPHPGVFKLGLINNPGTFDISEADTLLLQISQIRVYRSNGDFARIYQTLDSYLDRPQLINIFQMSDSIPERFQIGETYLPPEEFTEISLTINPVGEMILNGRSFPVIMPDSVDGVPISPVVRLSHAFRIVEHETTTVNLEFLTDQSLLRQRDAYVLKPTLRVRP